MFGGLFYFNINSFVLADAPCFFCIPDNHTGWNNVTVRILTHVLLGGRARWHHRGGPNDGDGTAAPPLDPGDAR